MKIQINNISKRFKKNWIFKELSIDLVSNESYAFTGSNGSGKSTLLKTIAGFEHFHKGNISYFCDYKELDRNDITDHFAFCAPYQDLIKEMKLSEFLNFHQKMTHTFDATEMLLIVGLKGHEDKLLDEFSSGMTQRLKLGLTFYSNKKMLLFDEPTTNLDQNGKNVFSALFKEHKKDKLIIIASNEAMEIDLCDKVLNIEQYKSIY
jgi:ABC-type multidrug transport system ATPase subunit